MLAPTDLKNLNVLVATPCYGGSLFQNYVASAIEFTGAAREVAMPLQFFFRGGDSLVTRSRNDCVAVFLSNPKFTHLFWIDADIGFSTQAAFRLLRSDHDVVAGVYPLKREDWPNQGVPAGTTQARFDELYARYTVNTGKVSDAGVRLTIDADGFMKVREAPTGFMVIKRHVFATLIEKYPELKYVPDWPTGTFPEGGVHYRFFDVMVDAETGRYLSEDYGFCRRWEAAGGEIYVDANSNLTHQGSKLYTGDFGATLRQAPTRAVGAAPGQRIQVDGVEHLNPKPRRSG